MPLVGTIMDPSTVRFGTVNVGRRCLVVIQIHSVLSAFNFSLLDRIQAYSSSLQNANFLASESTSSGLQ